MIRATTRVRYKDPSRPEASVSAMIKLELAYVTRADPTGGWRGHTRVERSVVANGPTDIAEE